MPVTLYRHQDSGAPNLVGAAGSMINLLDAVLVNGFSGRPGAGWTKVYSSGNIAVYRINPNIPGSTGMYLRVDDSYASYCIVRAYKTMSDHNTGTDMIPSGTPGYSNTMVTWHKGSDSTTARPWAIMADERTMYLNVAPLSVGTVISN